MPKTPEKQSLITMTPDRLSCHIAYFKDFRKLLEGKAHGYAHLDMARATCLKLAMLNDLWRTPVEVSWPTAGISVVPSGLDSYLRNTQHKCAGLLSVAPPGHMQGKSRTICLRAKNNSQFDLRWQGE